MSNLLSTVISLTTVKSLKAILSQLSSQQIFVLHQVSEQILAKALPTAKKKGDNNAAFLRTIDSILRTKFQKVRNWEGTLLTRALVARFALDLPTILQQLNLPDSVLMLYPEALERLSADLTITQNKSYDLTDDSFRKDISFVLGTSVPVGTLVVELTSYFLYRSVIRALTRPGNLQAIIRFFRVGGSGPWFRIHTALRHMADFNELGWEACYGRIADLLRWNTSIRGMIGTSWFYDPQLISISPRLAYLQKRPLERGAFTIRHGTSTIDIKRATLKSRTRQLLYSEGKYVPVSYSLLWPRRELIRWAESTSR